MVQIIDGPLLECQYLVMARRKVHQIIQGFLATRRRRADRLPTQRAKLWRLRGTLRAVQQRQMSGPHRSDECRYASMRSRRYWWPIITPRKTTKALATNCPSLCLARHARACIATQTSCRHAEFLSPRGRVGRRSFRSSLGGSLRRRIRARRTRRRFARNRRRWASTINRS